MKYIETKRSLDRKIKRLPMHDRRKLFRAIRGLNCFPNCQHVSKLRKDKRLFRLRVGAYRVLFSHSRDSDTISIVDVVRRDTQTFKLIA